MSAAPSHLAPLQILKFLCGVAWADGVVAESERDYILNLAQLMALEPADVTAVQAWLQQPPEPHDIAPSRLSAEDKRDLIQQALILVNIDGALSTQEDRLIGLLSRTLRLEADELDQLKARVQGLYDALDG